MLTPLDIENKKFSKQIMNGYRVEEVDDFLDDLTKDYEKIYKEVVESKNKLEEMQESISKYKSIEGTLQDTLVMAQATADEVRSVAKKQAEQIVAQAQADAKQAVQELEQEIMLKRRELDELQKQFDVYKAKMESLLIAQLEILKDVNKD